MYVCNNDDDDDDDDNGHVRLEQNESFSPL